MASFLVRKAILMALHPCYYIEMGSKVWSGCSKIIAKAHYAIKKNLAEMSHLFNLFANGQISNCRSKWQKKINKNNKTYKLSLMRCS